MPTSIYTTRSERREKSECRYHALTDKQGKYTPILLACYVGNPKCVEALAAKGADMKCELQMLDDKGKPYNQVWPTKLLFPSR